MKTFSLYSLIALILMMAIINSCHASVTSLTNSINDTLALWTPERMKSAKPLTHEISRVRKIKRNKINRNKINKKSPAIPPTEKEGGGLNYPVGKLIYKIGDRSFHCTASIINTERGDIGITAAHCLYDKSGIMHENFLFVPGYDFDKLMMGYPVKTIAVPDRYFNFQEPDYGLIRIDFEGLQRYTGSLGFKFDVGYENIKTDVAEYPSDGKFPNCPHDGEHRCDLEGVANMKESHYIMEGTSLGFLSSGGPWINYLDKNTQLGWVYAVTSDYKINDEVSVASVIDENEFRQLLDKISNA